MRIALTGAALFAALPLLALACGSPNVDITEYDQSCEIGDDCVAAVDGDPCCGCPNTAINKSELARYEETVAECSEHCDIGCGTIVVSCQSGTCALAEGGTVCTPGEEALCQCISGASGTKICNETGEAYGDCVCE